jgi:hypothetical protein
MILAHRDPSESFVPAKEKREESQHLQSVIVRESRYSTFLSHNYNQ